MSEKAVRAYAEEKRFSRVTVERWLRCRSTDRDCLLHVARQLRLGENHFRDIFDQMEDVAARQDCTVAQVLEMEEVAAVLERARGRNEALKALKGVLRRRRYPALTAVENRLKDLVRTLSLPRGVTISLPDNLEGSAVTLCVRAASAGELRRQLAAATAAAERDDVDELFRLLEGAW